MASFVSATAASSTTASVLRSIPSAVRSPCPASARGSSTRRVGVGQLQAGEAGAEATSTPTAGPIVFVLGRLPPPLVQPSSRSAVAARSAPLAARHRQQPPPPALLSYLPAATATRPPPSGRLRRAQRPPFPIPIFRSIRLRALFNSGLIISGFDLVAGCGLRSPKVWEMNNVGKRYEDYQFWGKGQSRSENIEARISQELATCTHSALKLHSSNRFHPKLKLYSSNNLRL